MNEVALAISITLPLVAALSFVSGLVLGLTSDRKNDDEH